MATSGVTEIPLSELSLPQLTQLSQQLDKEVDVLQSSLTSLKIAQSKFASCKEVLNEIKAKNMNKELLVPLNSSIYVPGEISNTDYVMVDIGTGYFVDMKVNKAKDYYQRKVKYLEEQMGKLQSLYQEKHRFKEAIIDLLQSKVQAQMSQQKASMK
ncbi:hypothetical protein HELRODRAFT_108802 [Helobdella robusta]|uniref:Prefoldin subunit 5 n=1 Tax=Helobdella robusta TaxID=6412 RepID=T1EEM6_HELRO|nr:hypothetical protein HELRODRAFT_108802 [Helobdella robusta]ESO11508.1 hypothetical protein HELRODRAFT_108802 [Helobdella robusta]